jgi:endonuclease YncB( thermonuclease family)
MSINLGNVLALLLLSVIGVAGVPSPAAGQNTFLNITASDVFDLVDNVTESVTERGDDDSSFPLASDNNNNNNNNNNSIFDLVDNVTESVTERGDDDSSFPLVNDSSISSYVITSDTIRINEIELNPTGNDEGKEWIELYNPAEVDINIGNFGIRTSSESATIKLPPDAVIGAGKTYVIEVNQHMLSNTVESLILTDATGNIKDRTPSLVDRSDDELTWQRIPDGNNEWQFVEDTRGNLNDPDSRSTTYDSSYSGSDMECLGSAGCAEGIAIRIVDADTLYVAAADGAVYKVDLAPVKAPSRTEERFSESTAFTRDLCLGSTVLVDQDDKLLTSNSSVIAVVYCSSSNLNSELLDNGYAELNVEQCAISEFANEPWVKDHGC